MSLSVWVWECPDHGPGQKARVWGDSIRCAAEVGDDKECGRKVLPGTARNEEDGPLVREARSRAAKSIRRSRPRPAPAERTPMAKNECQQCGTAFEPARKNITRCPECCAELPSVTWCTWKREHGLERARELAAKRKRKNAALAEKEAAELIEKPAPAGTSRTSRDAGDTCPPRNPMAESRICAEAFAALEKLGNSRRMAKKLLEPYAGEIPADMTTEDLVELVLREGKPRVAKAPPGTPERAAGDAARARVSLPATPATDEAPAPAAAPRARPGQRQGAGSLLDRVAALEAASASGPAGEDMAERIRQLEMAVAELAADLKELRNVVGA